MNKNSETFSMLNYNLYRVIRKFFLNHNKSFRWHLGDYEIITFFPLKAVRGETLIFVCSYGCVVGPLKTGLYKLNGRSGRGHASHRPSNGKKLCFS